MKKKALMITFVVTVLMLSLIGACAPKAEPAPTPPPAAEPAPAPTPEPVPTPAVPPEKAHLTPNPVETSMPIYGGTLTFGTETPRSFDAHQKAGYAPNSTNPVFNNLVQFDLAYQNTTPDNVIGDLAESWEMSPDGTEITFKLHQGVKWHDGKPFTAEDVVYSLDKMVDPTRSAISALFPAYESSEKIDDYTVKVHLKYPSATFISALANANSAIQAKHLAGTDDQSADFMVGTGPFIMTDYLVRVHMKFKRNPDYFKKDQYGNQLPYLDGLYMIHRGPEADAQLISRQMDLRSTSLGASSKDVYENLKNGAPDLLFRFKTNIDGICIQLNLEHKPLDDIRVRRALGLLVDEENLVIGYSGDAGFGLKDVGILHPSWGLPKEEVLKLMGWDKPWSERVAEAQKLMAEAGYPNGFKMSFLSEGISGQSSGDIGMNLVLGDTLRKHLNMDCEARQMPSPGVTQILDAGDYDAKTNSLKIDDPVQLKLYFGSGEYNNRSHYANPDFDKLLAGLDQILDPVKRRDALWEIDRTLLTDLPALPTGRFGSRYMPYYPHVKNLRFMDVSYSPICKCEDIWIDESLRAK